MAARSVTAGPASSVLGIVRPRPAPRPAARARALRWWRQTGPYGAALAAAGCLALAWLVLAGLRWAVVDAAWTATTPGECAGGAGACWGLVGARIRLLLFGLYPFDEHWRAALALGLFAAALLLSAPPALWRARVLGPLWLACLPASLLLLWGGAFGWPAVSSERWGGLVMSVVLFAGTVFLGFPLAVLLALARRSAAPALRWTAAVLIETVRAVPLLALFFFAAVVLPLYLGEAAGLNKLGRVMAAFAVFYACYQAEVLRGGLQAVPDGQREAALALGLGRRQTLLLVVLPQVLRSTLPATVNLFVITFKDTTLIVVVGLFELVASTNAALSNAAFGPFFPEFYVFTGGVFLLVNLGLSAYARFLERRSEQAR